MLLQEMWSSCKETQASPVASMKVWLLFRQLLTAELKPVGIAWVSDGFGLSFFINGRMPCWAMMGHAGLQE